MILFLAICRSIPIVTAESHSLLNSIFQDTDGDDDDNDGDEEEMEEGPEHDDEDRDALNRAVLDRMMEMQRAAQVDCASQCEDPAKEAELLSLKRKLRVKKRKLITAQSMADVAETGSNRPVLPAHLSLPHLFHSNPYKLNRYLPTAHKPFLSFPFDFAACRLS